MVRLYLIKHGRVAVDADMEGFLDVDTHQMALEEPDINIAVAWMQPWALWAGENRRNSWFCGGIYGYLYSVIYWEFGGPNCKGLL
jgi:hypothetical protein